MDAKERLRRCAQIALTSKYRETFLRLDAERRAALVWDIGEIVVTELDGLDDTNGIPLLENVGDAVELFDRRLGGVANLASYSDCIVIGWRKRVTV